MATLTDPTSVRWGILSTANIAVKAVMPAIRDSHNGHIAAIASRDLTRARRTIATVAPDARAYGDYDSLLEDPDIEAVYIPLPNSMHAEWAVRAAEHGKHILCEKPLGTTPEEVRRIIAASRAAGVLLLEAFMYRFHPQIQWALDQIAQGAIGEPRLVRSAFAFDIRGHPENIRLVASLAGGSLMDVGCYPLNFCRAIFGRGPQTVAARVAIPDGSEVERTVSAILDFGDGRLGMIDCSFDLPWHQFAEVVGDEGRLIVPFPYTPQRGAETLARIERGNETTEHRFAPANHYQIEVEHFASCIRSGTPLHLSPEDALEQAEAVEAIYRAAAYQRPW